MKTNNKTNNIVSDKPDNKEKNKITDQNKKLESSKNLLKLKPPVKNVVTLADLAEPEEILIQKYYQNLQSKGKSNNTDLNNKPILPAGNKKNKTNLVLSNKKMEFYS